MHCLRFFCLRIFANHWIGYSRMDVSAERPFSRWLTASCRLAGMMFLSLGISPFPKVSFPAFGSPHPYQLPIQSPSLKGIQSTKWWQFLLHSDELSHSRHQNWFILPWRWCRGGDCVHKVSDNRRHSWHLFLCVVCVQEALAGEQHAGVGLLHTGLWKWASGHLGIYHPWLCWTLTFCFCSWITFRAIMPHL